jgi:hypothetical protein
MPSSADERAQRVRLVEQQLHEQEEVDGLFDVSQDRVVAVTSERLIIVSGGGSQGWAQTSIPWRVITAVEAGPDESDGLTIVEYSRPRGRMNRNAEEMVTVVREDLLADAPEDARRMSALINRRRGVAE